MLSEHIDLIESLGLKLFFVAIFLLIGLAIQDAQTGATCPASAASSSGWFWLRGFCRQGADRNGLGRLRDRLTTFHL
jgi:hypothetical protein